MRRGNPGTVLMLGVALAMGVPAGHAPAAERVGLDVTRHELRNGMRFLIVPFGDAPVVATILNVHVGGVDDPKGQTGVAHLLEHMMFKGTTSIGTTDYVAELPHLARLQDLNRQLDRAHREGRGLPELRYLEGRIDEARRVHEPFVVKNEIWQIYQRCGGTGLNATTGNDFTQYFVQLPSNQLRVWARVESDRLANPVFREFYSERDVVHEERRMRTDSTARGRFSELFDLHAYLVHPYRQPVVGYADDIDNTDHEEVLAYFKAFYAPNNCVVALVGDVDPTELVPLIEEWFGPIPAQALPRRRNTVEPVIDGVRRLEVQSEGGTQLTVAFHVPAYGHPDMPALEVLSRVLSGGGGGRRGGFGGGGNAAAGRLTRALVEEQKVASRASASVDFGRYPGLLRITASPARGKTGEELESALMDAIVAFASEPPTGVELERLRIATESQAVRGLTSPMGIARALVSAEALSGDWRAIDRDRDALLAVTPEDVVRVARAYLTPERRVVALERGPATVDDNAEDAPASAPEDGR